jgi:glyoxylase-like metal-dependent hydrolase (beta-lactamase superfamily II)
MRKIAPDIFLETKYRGVQLGVIAEGGGLLLIDSPLFTEDGRSWLAELKGRGRARFLALLDGHPDRVIGARDLGVPILAHDRTRVEIREWPDTFKGATHQIGGECDQLKRIKGMQGAVPEITFSEEMLIELGDSEVVFWHRPGPTSGAIWALVPDEEVAFLGDCVTVSEPPYVGLQTVWRARWPDRA